MVICKYFLQGTCRFGSNCKFDHQIDDARQTHTSVLRPQNLNPGNPNAPAIDINMLVQSVANDMIQAEKGTQWLLSSYTPFKEKPNFPGFEDKSFEEVRLGFYEAQRNGTVDAYKMQLQWLLQETATKIKALQNPSPEAVNIIKTIYTTSTGSNNTFGNPPFSNAVNAYSNTPSSVFNRNVNTSSVFGNNQQSVGFNAGPNVFAQNNQQSNGFGNARPSDANSIFASASQRLFGGTEQQGSIFGGNQAPNSNTFVSSGGSQNIFNRGQPFTSQANTPNTPMFNQSSTPFATQQSTFNNTQSFSQQPTGTSAPFGAQPSSGVAPFNVQQPFGNQQQTGSSLFGAPPPPYTPQQGYGPAHNPPPFGMQPAMSVFGNQQQSNPPAYTAQQPTATPHSNIYGNNAAVKHSTNIFGSTFAAPQSVQSNSGFGGGFAPVEAEMRDESVYSKPEDLSEADLKNFESPEFELGKIPEKPPTLQMCF